MAKLKQWYVLTCEHRRYIVRAKTKRDANKYIQETADLTPKDTRVKLMDFGDFEIVK